MRGSIHGIGSVSPIAWNEPNWIGLAPPAGIIVVSGNGQGGSFVIPPGAQQPFLTLTFSAENIPDPPQVCVAADTAVFSSTGFDAGACVVFRITSSGSSTSSRWKHGLKERLNTYAFQFSVTLVLFFSSDLRRSGILLQLLTRV